MIGRLLASVNLFLLIGLNTAFVPSSPLTSSKTRLPHLHPKEQRVQLHSFFQYRLISKQSTPTIDSKMMYMNLNKNQEETSSILQRRSLASNYVIDMQKQKDEIQWNMYAINDVVDKSEINGGVGSIALSAMEAEIDVQPELSLHAKYQNGAIHVTLHDEVSKKEDSIIALLSRIMVQSLFSQITSTGEIDIHYPDGKETLNVQDLQSNAENGFVPLFANLLPEGVDYDTLEVSDFVTGDGEPIGYVPRILLHKANLLHRGIGIVACKDSHITMMDDDSNMPDLYCHQRTDTKRIFPSLYDMFVGGVATSGENLEVTAAREIGEELGLTRPSLSEVLFKCTVCTSYNRCVVTVYTYRVDSNTDDIKWQEEEVQWGGYVPYDVVVKSAALSVERLIDGNEWPGDFDDGEIAFGSIMDRNKVLKEDEWDYVPDGLLVWLAWIKYLKSKA